MKKIWLIALVAITVFVSCGDYVWSTAYTFTQTTTETYYMIHEADPGYVLTEYYWALIQWQNEDGSSDEVTSNKAYCYN